MTTKERWTVYPLLLLAIGLALRNDLGRGMVSADRVVCRELTIVGEPLASGERPIIVHAGRVLGGGGGRIEIHDADGAAAVAIGTTADSRDGCIEFLAGQVLLYGLGPGLAAPPQPGPSAD